MVQIKSAMTHTFDRTYYDEYDDCFQVPEITNRLKVAMEIEVYPNPSNGFINFKLPPSYSGNLSIKYTDGKFISSHSITKGALSQLQVDLKSGLYLFDFISDQGERITKKVIIVH
jgi:hypothetical protein